MGFLDKLVEKISGSNVYYPGCLTKFALPEIMKNYENILNRMGIDFIEIPEINCCGSPALSAGYKKDYESLKIKNKKIFKEYGTRKIFVNCPACFSVLNGYGVPVEHLTKTILDNIKKLNISNKLKGKVTYHDPCHLGRYSNIYDEPRKILEMLGYKIVEMIHSRESSMCCGGGGGLRTNFKDVSQKIRDMRLQEAKDTGAKILITSCPMCYLHLKENEKKFGLKVYEISQVIINAME